MDSEVNRTRLRLQCSQDWHAIFVSNSSSANKLGQSLSRESEIDGK